MLEYCLFQLSPKIHNCLENLGDQPSIFLCKVFELALVKIQDGELKKMDEDKVAFAKCLQVTATTQEITAKSGNTSDFAESFLKKKETQKNSFGANEKLYRHKISLADVDQFGTFFSTAQARLLKTTGNRSQPGT